MIELERVTHRYPRSRTPALSEVSLVLEEGVVGLVGPNGAGKTTLLKVLLGVLGPDAGSVRVGGVSPERFRSERVLGFIPERPSFPAYLTVAEFLQALAALAGRGAPSGRMKVEELSERRLGELSLGQKRRVEVAAALLGDPDLLLLDEPTNGLDPLALARFRELVRDARRPGRLILVSSHHLDELERVVDRVVMLDEGKVRGIWRPGSEPGEGGSLQAHFLRTVRFDER